MAGIQDMTPDAALYLPPIVQTSTSTALCYQGFKATPAAGWCLAHTIAHDEEHPLNRCYVLDRFERGGELDEYGTATDVQAMRIICPSVGRDYSEFRYGADARSRALLTAREI